MSSDGQETVNGTNRWRTRLCAQTLYGQRGSCLGVDQGIFQLQIATQGGRQIVIEDITGGARIDAAQGPWQMKLLL